MEQERKLSWGSIFQAGSVVDLDVKIWTAKLGIKPQDLGILNSPEVAKAISLGCYRLAPKESFDKVREVAARARRAVEYSSFHFAFIRGARFTPEPKLGKLLAELSFCKGEFGEVADEYCFQEYEGNRVEMLPIIRKACSDASKDPEVVEAAFSRILSLYPTKEEVRKKFSMSWTIYAIKGAQTLAAAEVAGQETENVKSIVRDMVLQLREEVSDRVGAVMGAFAKGAKIPKKTIDATRETIKRVDEMNIFNDRELSDQIRKLSLIVDRAENYEPILKGVPDGGIIGELASIQVSIEQSVEEAVQAAEESLTGLGKRKLDLSGEGAADAVR